MSRADSQTPVALITGGSRGIGAATAIAFAGRGADICINYRSKASRAQDVAIEIERLGRKCIAVQADLTEEEQIDHLAEEALETFGQVNYLIMNAAGGLERDKEADYARKLNVTANHRLMDKLLPNMPRGGTAVFVTSHPSHFYGRLPVLAGYERVASTKKEAEDTLRERISELDAHGVKLYVVSGDLIEGTINAKLMQREYPGLMNDRGQEVGPLPTVEEFSAAIVNAAMNPNLPQGETVLIGSTAWETYDKIHKMEQESSR